MHNLLRKIRQILALPIAAGVLAVIYMRQTGTWSAAAINNAVIFCMVCFVLALLSSVISLFLPAGARAWHRNLAALLCPLPENINFVSNSQIKKQVNIMLAMTFGARLMEPGNIARVSQGGGKEFFMCDVAEHIHGGKDSFFRYFTLCFAAAETIIFPDFILKPVGVDLPQTTPWDNIYIPSHPEFSDRYLLTGTDKHAVSVFFSPPVLTYFTNNPGWVVYSSGQHIVAYKDHKLIIPQAYTEYATECGKLLSLGFNLGQRGFNGFRLGPTGEALLKLG